MVRRLCSCCWLLTGFCRFRRTWKNIVKSREAAAAVEELKQRELQEAAAEMQRQEAAAEKQRQEVAAEKQRQEAAAEKQRQEVAAEKQRQEEIQIAADRLASEAAAAAEELRQEMQAAQQEAIKPELPGLALAEALGNSRVMTPQATPLPLGGVTSIFVARSS